MRKTRAKQLRKFSLAITPKAKSEGVFFKNATTVYRRVKKGFTRGKLHLKTIKHILLTRKAIQ